jgi:O-antigen/teichoic acid export membrane protein
VLRRAAGGAAVPLIAAVAVQSAGNLGFHAVVGRLLAPDGYGALGAVLAAMVMLGVPLGALQAAASALAAEGATAGRRTLRQVALWSAAPTGVVLLAAPAVRDFFHLGTAVDAALLAPYLAVAALLAAARGLLLGERRIGTVAVTYLAGTAVRLGAGLGLTPAYGVTGALAGTLAGEAASLAVAAGALRTGGPGALRLRAVGRAAVAVTGLFLFSTADLLLARHHLRGAESGAYVAAATVAKTVLALPAALMSAVFPRLVAAWPAPGRARVLATGGVLVVGPALAGAAAVAVAPETVMGLLYGARYSDAAALTRLLCAIAALTSVVTLLTHAALARRATTLLVPWVGAVFEVVLIQFWHATAGQVAAAAAGALVPTLLAIVAVEIRAWRRTPGRTLNPPPNQPKYGRPDVNENDDETRQGGGACASSR